MGKISCPFHAVIQTVYIIDMEAVMYVMCHIDMAFSHKFIMQALPFVVELDLAQRLCS